MNKHKLSILGLSLVMLAASCRKVDVQSPAAAAPAATAAATQTTASVWKTISSWNSSKADKYTSFNTTIQDSSITAATIANGLVLVYKKDGSAVSALPYQETGAGERYWYYQAAEGSLTINVDAYGQSQAVDRNASFQYFIITEQQIKDLEAQGKTKGQLMGLSYEEARTLFSK